MKNDKRLKVIAEEYEIGQDIEGKKIVAFGKPWKEYGNADKSHFAGQLWEECRCGAEPVYMPSCLCADCINRIYGRAQTVCYAYFE